MHIFLFDIDGTLVHTGGAGKVAFERAMASQFDIAEMNGNVLFAGRTDRAIARDLFEYHGVENSAENWARFLTAYLELLESLIGEFQGQVLPGVAPLLDELAQREDVGVGLLTGNVRDGARLKLSHYDLVDYFSFGGFGDTHVERNEVARDALSSARRHLGDVTESGEVIVIGDTPNDVRCARAIGAKAVAVATGFTSTDDLAASEPDVLVSELTDAEPVLRLLA